MWRLASRASWGETGGPPRLAPPPRPCMATPERRAAHAQPLARSSRGGPCMWRLASRASWGETGGRLINDRLILKC
ncbi:hypothetical protein PVAP13_5NG183681 [Panicum virgatum]|uniref:Uncharacterized protein n=1 Tax=Panicum virgatum TaxID=38727 RepID=A0A8T0RSV3_PANVG|nr:hypothetical protein PVAP13_5NG183681 [Panicum virgatum]